MKSYLLQIFFKYMFNWSTKSQHLHVTWWTSPSRKTCIILLEVATFHWLFLAASLIKLISDMHYRSRHRRCSVKKVFLENLENSQENSCATDSFLMSLWKNESLAQVFSCEFSKTKNTLFTEHLRTTASGFRSKLNVKYINMSNTNELNDKRSTKKTQRYLSNI